jgi:hypothetical protein
LGSEGKVMGSGVEEDAPEKKKLTICGGEFLIVLNCATGKLHNNVFIKLAGLRVNVHF